MAAFTTIAAATVSIGGSLAKGALAGDAATTAAREAGRLRVEQDRLEKESVARLEENFYSAVRATTDVYDRQLRGGNAFAAQLLESVQEGDQRGVAAGAGKIKQAQDATLGATADKFAEQKLKIDFAEAQAGELSASEIAALQDDRAAAAGLQADALDSQADQLRGQATGAFIDAGVSTLQAGVSLAGSVSAGKDAKAAEKLAADKGISIDDAKVEISKYSNKERRGFMKEGGTALDVSGRSNVPGQSDASAFESSIYDTQTVTPAVNASDSKNNPFGVSDDLYNSIRAYQSKQNDNAVNDFNTVLENIKERFFI
mgnify:CR=1 FL=1